MLSAIERLPSHMRSRALQRVSENANGPGGRAPKSSSFTPVTPRAPRLALRRVNSSLGVIPLEVRVTGPKAVQIGAVPAGLQILVDTDGGTPASVNIIDPTVMYPVTWAAAGVKTLTVTSPPGTHHGELRLSV